MSAPAIRLAHLTKSYGASRGIVDVSLEVRPGQVVGFLGPNGSGKTTAMRLLLGLLTANSGTAELFGKNVAAAGPKIRDSVGYLPGSLGMYSNLTGRAFLRFLARVRGGDCLPYAESVAQRLDAELDRRIKYLSKGNRQKLGVVQAFMHQPQVLVLDEPTSGLDPIVQREFELLLSEAKARGAAVLLASHVLSEVEHLADRVVVIHEGRVLRDESVSDLKRRAVHEVQLFFANPVEQSLYTRLPGVEKVMTHGSSLICTVRGAQTALLTQALGDGLVEVVTHEPSLDDIFMSLVAGGETP